MVRKTSRCFALTGLLALTLLSPTASLQAGELAAGERAAPQLSLLESLWQAIVSAACDHGICNNPGPTTLAGCDKGPLIDPNGGCTH